MVFFSTGRTADQIVLVRSSRNGTFRAMGLGPYHNHLEIRAEGFFTLEKEFEIEMDGADLGDLVLRRPVCVTGVVQDQNGRAVRDARVRLTQDGREPLSARPFAAGR